MQKSKWVRQKPQYSEGDYWFEGLCLVTRGVKDELPDREVIEILNDLFQHVRKNGGVDYLQKYKNSLTGQTVWVIDQITRTQARDGSPEWLEEAHYFTVMFPHEY